MKGTITINVKENESGQSLEIKGNMHGMGQADKILIVDKLAHAFELGTIDLLALLFAYDSFNGGSKNEG